MGGRSGAGRLSLHLGGSGRPSGGQVWLMGHPACCGTLPAATARERDVSTGLGALGLASGPADPRDLVQVALRRLSQPLRLPSTPWFRAICIPRTFLPLPHFLLGCKGGFLQLFLKAAINQSS